MVESLIQIISGKVVKIKSVKKKKASYIWKRLYLESSYM